MTDRRDSNDPRFDRWLSRRLHEAYDGVLREQLPVELDRLVQELGRQRREPGPRREMGDDGPENGDEGSKGRPIVASMWDDPSPVWH